MSDIFKYISSFVTRNRIRLKEPFQDFDRLKSSHVTRNQFYQCLKQLRLELTPKQLETVANRYISERSTPTQELVNWMNFIREIEYGLDNLELERNPSKVPVSTKSEDDFFVRRNKNTLSPQEEQQFQSLLQRLRHSAKQRGIIIKNLFADFDRIHHGTVTRAQFLQSLPFKEFQFSELQLLVKRYENQEGLVDYLVFHTEVTGDEQIGQIKFEGEESFANITPKGTESTLFHYDNGRGATLRKLPKATLAEVTEDKLKELVARHRVVIDENLKDFDPLRKGTVTVAQFQSSIGAIKFPKYNFTQAELDALTEKYLDVDENGKKSVRYVDLLDNVFRVFTEKDVEKNPKAFITPLLNTLPQQKRILSDVQEQKVRQLLDRIKLFVTTHRLYLKDAFIDFDRTDKDTNSTHITPNRFERALDTVGLKLLPQEYKLLSEKYSDSDNGEVNYRAFLQDVDWEDEPF